MRVLVDDVARGVGERNVDGDEVRLLEKPFDIAPDRIRSTGARPD